ncbi:hypothetical protein EXIGLDRAFT_217295 [Exidia glandulosa HHB12029]|uniref:Uncharacterized protein n=1 Tax=Exidia glandulosa HHB12029 TaxID=1314781 RepID=A0A165EF89_EXIGL|nr:hypothetical protein EXIGLDRAFT_217295 [Exidia glandulosa HHB12029]
MDLTTSSRRMLRSTFSPSTRASTSNKNRELLLSHLCLAHLLLHGVLLGTQSPECPSRHHVARLVPLQFPPSGAGRDICPPRACNTLLVHYDAHPPYRLGSRTGLD